MTLNDLITILPLVVLAGWGVLLLLADLWIPQKRKGVTAALAVVGMAVSMGLSLSKWGQTQTAFNDTVVVDGFAIFLDVVFLGTGIIAVGLAFDYLRRFGIERGEYYSLLIFTVAGMMLMTYADDLIIVFLALEFLSIPLYILAGFARLDAPSEEAALKYFLMGAFSSGFVLFGIALIFGATGHTDLPGIAAVVSSNSIQMSMFLIGAVLLLVGFSFKSAIVPFHMWSPDVYQGSPTSVTAFMSVGAKAAGFAAMLRVFVEAFPVLAGDLTPVLWGLAALTMVVGNLLALNQTNIKRLMAYSSIASAGYLLMAFVPYGQGEVLSNTISAMLFYLVAYSLTMLGAWGVVIAMEQAEGKGLNLADYAGLGRKYPWRGIAMTIFMLSFIGVPLTLGFWGKFYLFRTAVQGGFIGLAVIGLLTSVISAYYYLRVVVYMYMRDGDPQASCEPWLCMVTVLSAVAVVVLSFIPNSLLQAALLAIINVR